ncbi:hypothetical protein [uncultured Polaribacter sp.]|uniref:hypothetical protein n=1 Tax=uncultured Polaribacter sp. TaxID=174711 RepID=UPI0026339413|nr:hypothetical protein [uncultured Polaribacter sp.]
MKKLSIVNLILLLSIIVYLFLSKSKENLSENPKIIPEITTERLNIVGEDGNKFMVLSNPKKQALATLDGKVSNEAKTERGTAGLLFFNEEGDEVGGLVYGIDDEGTYQLLTFDQYKGDQIMALRKDEYLEDGEWKRQYGLLIQERSPKRSDIINKEYNNIMQITDSVAREKKFNQFYEDVENRAPQRLFIGRTYAEQTGLFLMDKNNKLKLQICVDKDGQPHIDTFDDQGNKKQLVISD